MSSQHVKRDKQNYYKYIVVKQTAAKKNIHIAHIYR